MSDSDKGQVSRDAAEVYDQLFVPALFQEWAPRVAETAAVRAGQAVLDVACGTGVLARELAARVGPTGSVVGVDVNPGMLAVARRAAPHLAWTLAPAEKLPFADARFDAAVCQFGLMFFEDRALSLREMVRVTRPQGRIALAVWDTLERSPGYVELTALLARLFGPAVARGLDAPFSLGDPARLRELLAAGNLGHADLVTASGRARFPSLKSWVHTEVRGWTLSDAIDDAGMDALLSAADDALAAFVQPDGTVAFETRVHLASARKA
jgi:ubiquinone/menaquinone biosynthesis C-methylase UbiE